MAYTHTDDMHQKLTSQPLWLVCKEKSKPGLAEQCAYLEIVRNADSRLVPVIWVNVTVCFRSLRWLLCIGLNTCSSLVPWTSSVFSSWGIEKNELAFSKSLEDDLAVKSTCVCRTLRFSSKYPYLWWLTAICDSCSRGLNAFFWPLQAPCVQVIHRQSTV